MFKKFKKSFNSFRGKKNPVKSRKYKKTVGYLRSHPFISFFSAMGFLLLIIVLGNVVTGLGNIPKTEEKLVKNVSVYAIGESPRITMQARVNQEGVIEVVAQTPGIVQEIYVYEGEQVSAGQTLVNLSTNYQGGNTPALQANLAGAQYKNIKTTFDAQKDIIAKQREVANKSFNNTDELRKISDNAESDTRGLLELNETILTTLSDQLEDLEQNNATDAEILQAQQLKSQAQAGVNQLRTSLRNLEYTTNTDNPPTDLAELQKDISLKQLDIQEKALELSRETSKIQYNIALTQAALMRPAAPFNGTVEKINVSVGEAVNPGTVIAVISSDKPEASLVVRAPQEIAKNISRGQASIFTISGKKVEMFPSYISSVATDGQLFTILYSLSEEYINKVTNNSFIPVEIPIGYADTVAAVPFIPIDSVFQSQNASFVFLAKDNRAVSQEVKLGNVYGSFVEVESGIKNRDKLILERNVVSGEQITIQDN